MSEATGARPRRRGKALESAIFEATLQELGDVGFLGFSMERVAERARTGKASLYRRWPTRTELVLAAVRHELPERIVPADQGSLRADLLAALMGMATELNGPLGQALRGVIADAMRSGPMHPASLSSGQSRQVMRTMADRAVARGELAAAALTDAQLDVAPTAVRHRFLSTGQVGERDVVAIVDEVVLPLWRSVTGAPGPDYRANG